jgi:hypothetical protein
MAMIEEQRQLRPLILKRGDPSRRRDDDYDVLENGKVVGRIFHLDYQRYPDEIEGTPEFRRNVLKQLAKMHNRLLDKSETQRFAHFDRRVT